MKPLIAKGIEKAFGDRFILRGASINISPGDRVGLVGVNGSGKTTLLSILAGDQDADHGEVLRDGRHAYLPQAPTLPGRTVGEAIDEALEWHTELLNTYYALLEEGRVDEAAPYQDRLDQAGWDLSHRADSVLTQVQGPPREALTADLSGGETRRVALARCLLGQPDLLLLDEPTNHLDADTVEWLQGYLQGFRGAILLVTHDRYLLEAVANRIVEVEDGQCVSYQGSYADYLVASVERRGSQEKAEDRRLALIEREAAWASRSPAARSTKQKGRLKRLDELKQQRALSKKETFELDFSTGARLPGTLLELRDVSHGYTETDLISGFDLVVHPGDRIGILGPNGAGKSTLLKILAGSLSPRQGEMMRSGRVKVAVLDQHRTGLPLDGTVFEAAGGGNDWVKVGDQDLHVASFLNRFLFGREYLDQRVAALSGGERARLLLAKLLLAGANLLMLDEPTNDLDLQTLRVLEEALLGMDGACIVVTHDRALLDRVCSSVLAFEGDGHIQTYASRLQHVAALARRNKAPAPPPKAQSSAPAPKPQRTGKKLSYKEKTELEALPQAIEDLEQAVEDLNAVLAEPNTYTERRDELPALTSKLADLERQVEETYARWEALSERA